jgi:exoribonuclease-2
VTSPLRRYLDLVAHQQLHLHLAGRPLLSSAEVSERIATSDGISRTVRRVERSSNMHWKLLYLMRHPNWQGTGVVVESMENRAKVIIPELALETRVRLREPCPLDTELQLVVREIDLEDQVVWFRLLN